jgi:CRISPR-associated endoribonuclease Cas6/Csy4 subtype I-F
MKRYYIDICILDPHGLASHVMTQLVSNAHRLLREHSMRHVGISFPQYGLHNAKGVSSLGNILRFVSIDSESLKKLAGNVTFHALAGVSVIKIEPLLEVPQDRVTQEVVFLKDNKPIRYMRQHREDVAQDSSIAQLSYHHLKGASVLLLLEKRGQGAYPIFIARHVREGIGAGEFNSYGLSQQDGPTVPIF